MSRTALLGGLATLGAIAVAERWGRAAVQGVALGALFGIASLLLIAVLVRELVRVEKPRRGRAAVLTAVKFPALYAAAYLAVRVLGADLIAFLVGFTLVLVALVAAALVTHAAPTSSNDRSGSPPPGADTGH